MTSNGRPDDSLDRMVELSCGVVVAVTKSSSISLPVDTWMKNVVFVPNTLSSPVKRRIGKTTKCNLVYMKQDFR